MLTSHVQKIARVLNILVLIALVCNLILLFFVPVAVRSDQSGLLLGTGDYLSGGYKFEGGGAKQPEKGER